VAHEGTYVFARHCAAYLLVGKDISAAERLGCQLLDVYLKSGLLPFMKTEQ